MRWGWVELQRPLQISSFLVYPMATALQQRTGNWNILFHHSSRTATVSRCDKFKTATTLLHIIHAFFCDVWECDMDHPLTFNSDTHHHNLTTAPHHHHHPLSVYYLCPLFPPSFILSRSPFCSFRPSQFNTGKLVPIFHDNKLYLNSNNRNIWGPHGMQQGHLPVWKRISNSPLPQDSRVYLVGKDSSFHFSTDFFFLFPGMKPLSREGNMKTITPGIYQ